MVQQLSLKQETKQETKKTSSETISCGITQDLILGALPFYLYVNDLKNISNILDPVMSADDSNLFFTRQDIRYLFQRVKQELDSIKQRFISNKLSLYIYIYICIYIKPKYTFFHKASQKEGIPFFLPKVIINYYKI